MNITIEYNGKQLTKGAIEEFEGIIGSRLPDEYKDFLKKFNGGRPTPRKFVTVDKKTISRVKMFFPLGREYMQNLEEFYFEYNEGEKIPKTLLPIGIDPM